MHRCQVNVDDVIQESSRLYAQGFAGFLAPGLLILFAEVVGKFVEGLKLRPMAWVACAAPTFFLGTWGAAAQFFVATSSATGTASPGFGWPKIPWRRLCHFLYATIAVAAIEVTGDWLAILMLVGTMAIASHLPLALLLAIAAKGATVLGITLYFGLYGAAVMDDTSLPDWREALQRSWTMMSGHRWRGARAWAVPVILTLFSAALIVIGEREASAAVSRIVWVFGGHVMVALALPLFATTSISLYRAINSEELAS